MKESLTTQIITPPDPIDDPISVRREVFQVEQGIAMEIDIDGLDNNAIHIIARTSDGKPVGAGRVRIIEKNLAKIERIATLSSARGLGVATKVMEGLHQHLISIGITETTLDAQVTAKGLYLKLGYEEQGEEFEEAGIQHIVMTKNLNEYIRKEVDMSERSPKTQEQVKIHNEAQKPLHIVLEEHRIVRLEKPKPNMKPWIS